MVCVPKRLEGGSWMQADMHFESVGSLWPKEGSLGKSNVSTGVAFVCKISMVFKVSRHFP